MEQSRCSPHPLLHSVVLVIMSQARPSAQRAHSEKASNVHLHWRRKADGYGVTDLIGDLDL